MPEDVFWNLEKITQKPANEFKPANESLFSKAIGFGMQLY